MRAPGSEHQGRRTPEIATGGPVVTDAERVRVAARTTGISNIDAAQVHIGTATLTAEMKTLTRVTVHEPSSC